MAVFTPVSHPAAEALLEAYDLGRLQALEPVAEGVENTTYRLTSDRGAFALTLFETRTPPAALPFIIGLMEHMAGAGAPVPRPERTRAGALLSAVSGRPAALVAWLPGRWSRAPTPAMAEAAGRVLAELHLAGADFPQRRPNALGNGGWTGLIQRCASRAEGSEAGMLQALEAEARVLTELWPRSLPSGAVHLDYFPDNVLFEEGRLSAVIDFCFAGTDSLAYDLAIGLAAWGFAADGAPDPARLDAFRGGYEAVRPLGADEQAALPLLCRGAAVRFTLTRLHDRLFHDPAWRVDPHDPWSFFARLLYFQGAQAPGTSRRVAS